MTSWCSPANQSARDLSSSSSSSRSDVCSRTKVSRSNSRVRLPGRSRSGLKLVQVVHAVPIPGALPAATAHRGLEAREQGVVGKVSPVHCTILVIADRGPLHEAVRPELFGALIAQGLVAGPGLRLRERDEAQRLLVP